MANFSGKRCIQKNKAKGNNAEDPETQMNAEKTKGRQESRQKMLQGYDPVMSSPDSPKTNATHSARGAGRYFADSRLTFSIL